MATHSSILAWRIPWTEEPGGLLHAARLPGLLGVFILSFTRSGKLLSSVAAPVYPPPGGVCEIPLPHNLADTGDVRW